MPVRLPSLTIDISIVLSVLAAIAAYLAFRSHNPAAQNILAGIATTCLGAVAVRTTQWIKRQLKNKEFRGFFGPDALNGKIHLIYPAFCLSPEVSQLLDTANIDRQRIFGKSAVAFDRAHRVDIPKIGAINDIEALLHIAVMFSEYSSTPPPIRPDGYVLQNSAISFISFGFSSNECTHMYLDACSNPLFVVKDEPANSTYGEYVQIEISDQSPRDFHSSKYYEIGLVLAHTMQLETDPRWFFCAGLGPVATIGAGEYLACHWKDLYKLVGTRDFICVLSVATHYKRTRLLLVVANSKVVFDAEAPK